MTIYYLTLLKLRRRQPTVIVDIKTFKPISYFVKLISRVRRMIIVFVGSHPRFLSMLSLRGDLNHCLLSN